MAKVRVLLADDHAILRAGLRLLINTQADLEVIGEAADHREVQRQAALLHPDIVILDLSMPGGTLTDSIQGLTNQQPGLRVIVLTMHDDPAYFRIAMAAGAMGYVVKKAADNELLEAIRTVANGRVFAHSELAKSTAGLKSVPNESPLNSLSDREREVLVLVAQGHTNQAVADKLELSVKTVESYRARLMNKLGLKSRAELTQLAIDSGILQAGPSSMPDN